VPSWRQRVLPHLGTVAFCLALVVVATYPVVARLRTHLPSSWDAHDGVVFVWNNWWIHHAVVDLHQNPYFTDWVLVPFSSDLRLHTFGLLYGLLSIPFIPLLGPIGVTNAQLLLTPALNGYAVFLLARRWFGRNDVGIVSAAAFAMPMAVLYHFYMGRPAEAAFWPVPLVVLFLDRLIEAPRWRSSVGLAAALLAMLTVDQQIALYGGLVVLVYLVTIAVRRPRALMSWRLAGHVVGVVAVLAYPFEALVVRPFVQTRGYTIPDPSEALRYSLPLRQVAYPPHLWQTFGLLLPVGLIAGIAIVRRERRAVFGVSCALLCSILALGPIVPGTGVRLPFAWLQHVPGFAHFRMPFRLQMPAAFGMAMALAAALAYACARLEGRRLWGRSAALWFLSAMSVVVAIDTLVRWHGEFPTYRLPEEVVYQRIRDTPGDFVVLEVPFGMRSGTDLVGRDYDLMFYQTIHGKRMLGGYLSRVPLAAINYYRSSPALMFLGNEPAPAGTTFADVVKDFASILQRHDVGYIVVHPELLDADRLRGVRDLLRAQPGLEPLPTGTTSLAFRVSRSAS
jgi:hypothetical protein